MENFHLQVSLAREEDLSTFTQGRPRPHCEKRVENVGKARALCFLVSGRGCARSIFGSPGAGGVCAGKVLDIAVPVHLEGHDRLLYGFLMAAGRSQEVFWKAQGQITDNMSVMYLQFCQV